MELPKLTFLRSTTREEQLVKAIAATIMVDRLAEGRRVVVGTMEAVEVGCRMARVSGGWLVIKRRATRQEFLDACPLQDERDRHLVAELATLTAPFYYELELIVGEA